MGQTRTLFTALVLVLSGAVFVWTQGQPTADAGPEPHDGVKVQSQPVADAGPDASIAVGKTLTLDGTGSFDLDGDKLTYQWSVVSAPAASRGLLTAATKSKAKLKIDRAGVFVVQLVVRDGTVASIADQVVVTTVNTTPVANAGPDRVGTLAVPVQLDGAASSDADGDPLTYSWKLKRPGGSSASLSSTSGPRPTFVPDVNGNYVATLTVDDGTKTKTDNVIISTANLAPVARAGRDYPAAVAGQKIVLDGSGSTDANGDLLTYAWAITKKPGSSAATLGSANTVRATFTADVKGKYTFTLTVTDPSGAVSTDQILHSAAPPQADAGSDRTALAGDDVVLDGSASSHLAGGVWYGWSLLSVPVGSAAAFEDPSDPQPRFTADLPGIYVAQLMVFDGLVLGPADTVVVSVAENTSPRVDLGPDQVVPTSTIVTLDSDAVSDPDAGALTFRWALIARPAGSAAAMSSVTGAVSQTTADVAGAYVVQLTATDHVGASSTDTVVITTANGRPAVGVGADRGATAGAAVPLAAVASDPDGTGIAYAWTFLLRPDESSASLTDPAIANPSFTPDVDGVYVVQVMVTDPDGLEAFDAVVVRAVTGPPVVTIAATDDAASEVGPDAGTFTFTRSGSTTSALSSVAYTRAGTATAGADYSPSLPASGTVNFAAGQATTTITITPINEGAPESAETVILTLSDGAAYDLGAPATQTATVTIADFGGSSPLDNGFMHTGTIATAGEVDTWTFPANAGDRIAVHIGEIVDDNGFRPWIRLISPTGGTLADLAGDAATYAELPAPGPGVYTVLVASYDSGLDGTGTYRLTMVNTPGPYSVSPADQGGALTNGAVHTGEIVGGDVDVWTFTASANDRIGLHLTESVDSTGFRPWLRVWSPTGVSLADLAGDAATYAELLAPGPGVYTVLVASYDSGLDAAGTYRLETVRTPGTYTVSPGDQGGALTNGAVHTGEIVRGDVDVWTFTASANDRIDLHLTESVDSTGFRPWLRVWSPTGVSLADLAGDAATYAELLAPGPGVYTVLVASYDSGLDAAGTYRLETVRTPGTYTVSPGDQGGALTNGAVHTGEIVRGDVDVWTFTASANDRIDLHLAELVDSTGFRPWLRVWSPTGVSLADLAGDAATYAELLAPSAGVYTVLVASYDSGLDAAGTYRLETVRTPGPVAITPGDNGGTLTSGAAEAGSITMGDVDAWTITAVAGQHITVNIAETLDGGGFRPWIRLWAPTGASLGDVAGDTSTMISGAFAPATGTYLVLVGTYDSGVDATGSYSLTATVGP